MIKIVLLILIILVIILLATFFTLRIPTLKIDTGSNQNEKLKTLDKWFEDIHKLQKFNGTVLLAKDEKIIFSQSYGSSNIESNSPITEHSSFNLASVSKQFTAMGIVILNNQSKLNYSDKISDYIPELSFYKDITIEQLLQHTSGIPDYMHLTKKYNIDTDIFTIQKMIALYKKHQPKPNFKSGKKFQYSNTGYILLAEIIERISGTPFSVFMSNNIFKPLHMHNTQVFNLLSEDEPAKRVYGFKRKFWVFGGKQEMHDLNYFDGVVGDGSIYSSAYDLYLWHKALINGTLVPKEDYQNAYTRAVLLDGSKSNYGYGWFINKDDSIEHSGGWQGFSSYIYRDIKNNNLIIILDNSSNALRVNAYGFRFNSFGINLKEFINTL